MKKIFTFEFIQEETKCVRCGTIVTREKSVVITRKHVLEAMKNVIGRLFIITLIVVAFYVGMCVAAFSDL